MKRVAVVGIDGSGKSSLVRRCAARAGAGALTMTCPAYHDTGDAPLQELSRTLEAFSSASDELRAPAMKAAAMYLQMSLYGPVERFLVETFTPAVVISERHAIIDPIAYSPLYERMMDGRPDPSIEPRLVEKLGAARWARVLDWQAREARRLGVARALWDIPAHLLALARRPWPELLDALLPEFRCRLPDVVVMLDIPAQLAAERVSGRAGTKEVHEGLAMLGALRKAYLGLLEVLKAKGVQTEVLDGTRGSPDELVTTLLERLDLPRA
jgi:thymidylate kinase